MFDFGERIIKKTHIKISWPKSELQKPQQQYGLRSTFKQTRIRGEHNMVIDNLKTIINAKSSGEW